MLKWLPFTLGAYRATAFYQSEGLEPRERRKSEAQQARGNQQDVQQTPQQTAFKNGLVLHLEATVSEYGKNLQDCKMEVLVGGQTTAQPG